MKRTSVCGRESLRGALRFGCQLLVSLLIRVVNNVIREMSKTKYTLYLSWRACEIAHRPSCFGDGRDGRIALEAGLSKIREDSRKLLFSTRY